MNLDVLTLFFVGIFNCVWSDLVILKSELDYRVRHMIIFLLFFFIEMFNCILYIFFCMHFWMIFMIIFQVIFNSIWSVIECILDSLFFMSGMALKNLVINYNIYLRIVLLIYKYIFYIHKTKWKSDSAVNHNLNLVNNKV